MLPRNVAVRRFESGLVLIETEFLQYKQMWPLGKLSSMENLFRANGNVSEPLASTVSSPSSRSLLNN